MRRANLALAITACFLSACGSSSSGGSDSGITLTAAERSELDALSPSVLPAPGDDASNRFADRPEAAALGQKLFFEPAFSGKLLEGDNDGSKNALGVVGQTGKVACAGCH